ncbi:MAG: RNA-binding S4 domain-containing protein [Hyphomicrobiales bacterium]|nr:RNA-binding S4 domain-containing protein [Hyphomicrobiales bacterium]
MTAGDLQRIDKWLFFARVTKSRSLAARLVLAGRVRVNREKVEQAAYPVKQGDVLTVTLDRRVLVYRILGSGVRRGPAVEARALYEDLTPAVEETPGAPPARAPGAGRPTKKERRALDRLNGESG